MKKSIKCLSAVLMTSVLAVSAGAVAAPTFAGAYDITMSSTTGHTYTAYQIFDGDLYESGSTKTLSNITWGANINDSTFLTALQGSSAFGSTNPFAGKTTAAQVASVVDNWDDTTDAAKIKAFAELAAANLNTTAGVSGTGTITIDAVNAGYYLIKDTTASASMPAGGTYSDFMLKVVSDVTVAAKDETVTSDKKVTDANDSDGSTEPNKTTADYDIGDDVPYVLTFTLPAKYAEYEKYPITFTDDMCAGLTYNGDAKIYYGAGDTTGTTISLSTTTGTEYTGGQKYTYSIADLKAAQEAAETGSALKSLAAGSVIRIEYTAKLNAGAVIGSAGNPNKYSVTFANDPTWYDDGVGGTQPDTPPTGTTPEKVNTVFTYKLVVNKVKSDNTALTGADFTLYKFIKSATGSDTYGEDNGTWTSVTALNSGEGAVNPTKATSANGTVADSVFTFAGIDDGVYKLVESTTPEGYNTIDPIIFTIAPTADGDLPDTINLGSASFSCTDSTGAIEGNVINNAGVTLPGTGGIGTTVFYIIGGLMITGALVLFIVKKRMNIKEK